MKASLHADDSACLCRMTMSISLLLSLFFQS